MSEVFDSVKYIFLGAIFGISAVVALIASFYLYFVMKANLYTHLYYSIGMTSSCFLLYGPFS